MIHQITINGFKSIQKSEVKDLKNINLFVGKNNCGKTTLLEALYLCCTAVDDLSLLHLCNLRGISESNIINGINSLFSHKSNEKSIDI